MLLMRVCRDCRTPNHDFQLYCQKCSASLYLRPRPVTAQAIAFHGRLVRGV